MYHNIGAKIKSLAATICTLGILASALFGILLFKASPVTAAIFVLFGCLMSWVSSLTLYGFGQLIEDSAEQKKLCEEQKKLVEQLSSAVFYGFSQLMEDKK